MSRLRPALAALFALPFSACSNYTMAPDDPSVAQAPIPDEVLDPDSFTPKPTLAQARSIADNKLKVGMTQDDVQWLLGRPDKAGMKVYGAATPTPWEGVEWEYDFAEEGGKVLLLVFQNDQGSLRLRVASWV